VIRQLRRRIRRAICRHSQLIVCSNGVACSGCYRIWSGSPALIGVDVRELMDVIVDLRERAAAWQHMAQKHFGELTAIRPTIPEPSKN
jgi:hypothetical protein